MCSQECLETCMQAESKHSNIMQVRWKGLAHRVESLSLSQHHGQVTQLADVFVARGVGHWLIRCGQQTMAA